MNTVTVKEAARILECSEQFVRISLQRKSLPIGSAEKLSSKYTYNIPRERLMAYMEGRDIKMPPAATDGRPPHGNEAERTL